MDRTKLDGTNIYPKMFKIHNQMTKNRLKKNKKELIII
jgi:hypothetical protein